MTTTSCGVLAACAKSGSKSIGLLIYSEGARMRNVQVAWMPAAFLGVILVSCGGGCANQQANVTKLRSGYDALNARQLDAAMLAADEVLAAQPQQTLPAEAHYLRGRVFEERALTLPATTPG